MEVQYDLDWGGGLAEYGRAIELDPSLATVYHYRGIVLAMHGATERARVEFERAQHLDPHFGFLAQDPTFDALHDDPRFASLVARIGVWKRALPARL